jgi:polyhydroxybutyrate depolymerase
MASSKMGAFVRVFIAVSVAIAAAIGSATAQQDGQGRAAGGLRAAFETRIEATVAERVAAAEAAGMVRNHVVTDGGVREYLFVPGTPDNTPAPLVIVLHGGSMNAEQSLAIEYGGLWVDRARQHGFALAFPQGAPEAPGSRSRNWNDCRAVSRISGDGGVMSGVGPDSTLDDVAFIMQMIDDLARAGNIDPARIYVAGASNGGMMTLRLLLEAGERFAGFAPSIASLPALSECPSSPRVRKPLIYTYGTHDEFIPVDGGCVADTDGSCARGRVLAQSATIQLLATAYGAKARAPRAIRDRDNKDGTRQVETDYAAKDVGTVLRVVRVEGGGHTTPAPGRSSPVTERMFGKRNGDRHAVDYIGEFFGLMRNGADNDSPARCRDTASPAGPETRDRQAYAPARSCARARLRRSGPIHPQ